MKNQKVKYEFNRDFSLPDPVEQVLKPVDVMEDFTYDPPFGQGLTLSGTSQTAKKTAVVFLRYYGCPLYVRYAVRPASSILTMMDESSMAKMASAAAAGYQHGQYEGNEFQLPAVFVLDTDRRV